MNKRDLKADLELFNKATPGPWEFGPIYAGTIAGELDEERHRANRELLNNFREGWPHAIERALKAEALAQKLVDVLGRVVPRYLVGRPELDLDLVHEAEKERADKLESLVRDVERVLERMKFLSEEGLMIDEIDDYQLDVAIAKAKEVLVKDLAD